MANSKTQEKIFFMPVGSAGAGKSTIVKEVIKKNKNVTFMPSVTTRKMVREDEKTVKRYERVSDDEFKAMIKDGKLLEYEQFHGNYYGVSKELFEKYIENGHIIKDIGIKGAQYFHDTLSGNKRAVSVFIDMPKKVLEERLKIRGEKPNRIKVRLSIFKKERNKRNHYNYIMDNIVLEDAVSKMLTVITNETKNKQAIPTVSVNRVNKDKVIYYMGKLHEGKYIKPIKVAIKDNRFYIISGHNKYLAGVLSGKIVSQKIVKYKKLDKLNSKYEKDWDILIKDENKGK